MISHLDHLVLTVRSIDDSVRFYMDVLGMEKEVFGEGRVALKFGSHKINLHQQGKEFEPKAQAPTQLIYALLPTCLSKKRWRKYPIKV